MIQKVLLPKLGQTVETATIEAWRKKEGEVVEKGDVLCDITTDKATIEFESYQRGTLLKIVAPAGVELPIDSLIAVLGEPGERVPPEVLAEAKAAAAAPAQKTAEPAQPAAQAPAPKPAAVTAPAPAAKPVAAPAVVEEIVVAPTGKIFVSPRARTLAAASHVPLLALRGSGPNGRIVEVDVASYLAKVEAAQVTPLARKLACERNVDVLALVAEGKKVTKDDVLAAKPITPSAAPARVLKTGRVKLTPMRRIIAERMAQSKREIPGYYLHMDADLTDLMEARKRLNNKTSEKVSINDSSWSPAAGRWPSSPTPTRSGTATALSIAARPTSVSPFPSIPVSSSRWSRTSSGRPSAKSPPSRDSSPRKRGAKSSCPTSTRAAA
jgi:pyruvate dehydrogenase E2 component (dihydrolipoamide acetyltransferase)